AEKQAIPYPLLSDLGSRVIRDYGILNDQIGEEGGLLYGIPYPGVYVTDEQGVVVAKFFNDSYKKRDSPELYLDAALGRIEIAEEAPRVSTEDPEVRITAAVHGGKGTIRLGIRRKLVLRFELSEGLHLYGEPVPKGLTSLSITPTGPDGLRFGDPVFPPTESLRTPGIDETLPVWHGSFDVAIPFYADSRLISDMQPLDRDAITIEVDLAYQACNDEQCLLPKTEKLSLDVPTEVVDVPHITFADHVGNGQREGNYDGMPHLRRYMWRAFRNSPLGMLRFIANNIRLELTARRRNRS
nr:protein-disulfide reductase DsbD family protein [Myxococcota bacterium]